MAEKDLEVLVASKNQPCDLTARPTSNVLSYTNRSIACRLREAIYASPVSTSKTPIVPCLILFPNHSPRNTNLQTGLDSGEGYRVKKVIKEL